MLPDVKWLNIEYLFNQFFKLLKKLLEFIIFIFQYIDALIIFSIIFSIILVIAIFVIARKVILLREKRGVYTLIDFLKEEGEPRERVARWESIKNKINSDNSANWRMAILEADSLLDSIFRKIGYRGDGLGERLKAIEPSDFDNLQNVWDAHKVRNRIAHGAPEMTLSKEDAKATIEKYKAGLEELKYI
ncbi:MAG: hypothetical protein Q8Q21_01620 [bacterium]|nr:hypothetical protein [bacterium]